MAARGTLSPPTSREQTASQVVKRRSPLHHLLTNRVMWVAVAVAVIASLAYLMIEIGVLGVGPAKGPAGIVYAAAGGYLLGGLLILVRRRWLWMIDATINALVVLFFVSAYQDRPEVFFSLGGLVTKTSQVLEVCLIYLILTYRRHPRRHETRGSS